ncbi:MAG: FMN-binding protein [Oscillospiraceae bacterium]|jgi:uncharacterized protein with FMN-binding domain|nr:FMN-binding protein [Oscillospiraceae bacterium]
MKRTRKVLIGTLAGVMLLLAACGGGESAEPPAPEDAAPPAAETPAETDAVKEPDSPEAPEPSAAAPEPAPTPEETETPEPAAAPAAAVPAKTADVTVPEDKTPTAEAPVPPPAATPESAPPPAPTPTPTPTPTPPPAVSTVYRDGIYSGKGEGYSGGVTVSVTIAGDKLTAVSVTKHTDDPLYMEDAMGVIQKILSAQSTEVDTVSGATFSSGGIIDAVAAALASAKN